MRDFRWCMAFLLLACGSSETKPSQNATPKSPGPGDSQNIGTTASKAAKPKTPAKPTGDMLFSFIDHRVHAHKLASGGLAVDGGHVGFAKYTRYRRDNRSWQWKKDVSGKSAAVPAKSRGTFIKVPLTDEQAKSGRIKAEIHSKSEGRLTLRINGDKSTEATVSLPGGWFTFEAQVKGLKAGENDIAFWFGGGDDYAVAQFLIGTKSKEPALPTLNNKTIKLPDGSGIVIYTAPPKGTRLFADVADCPVKARVMRDKDTPIVQTLTHEAPSLSLDQVAGAPARIELSTDGCDATLAAAGIYGTRKTAKPAPAKKPKRVVLWIMDSLRADRVRQFNPKARAESPNFERLTKSATFFTHTYVQGNESKASHASIWSALYPVKHGMGPSGKKLSYEWTTIDEVASSAQYATVGVSSNGYIIKKWGFEAAWDKYINHIHKGGGFTADNIYKRALDYLKDVSEPWFLYMGTIDTHVSWRAKQPWMDKYAPKGYSGRFKDTFSGSDAGKAAGGKIKMSEADIENVRAIYDSNVSYQDQVLGKLLDKLEKENALNDTMIIITADHGDEQWEHGRVGHGGSLRETLVHVPLVIHYPPVFPAKSIDTGVEVIDIVPTVAEVLGVKPSKEWQGASLVELARAGASYPLMAIASQYENRHAATLAGYKVIVAGTGKPRVYNVKKDPGENNDLVDSHPIARRTIEDSLWILRAWGEEWSKARWGNAAWVSDKFASAVE